MAKDNGKSFLDYIYTMWQKNMANHLKFIQTIIGNYRCK